MNTSGLFRSDLLTNFSIRYKSVLAALLISGLMVDTMLSNISDISADLLGSYGGKALFLAIIIIIYGPAYLLLIGYSRRISSGVILKAKDLYFLYKGMVVSIHILIVLLIVMSFQIIFSSEYHIFFLVVITAIGYTLSAIILSILAFHMYLWYKGNKRNLMLLLFVLAAAMTATASMNLGLAQNGLVLQTDLLLVKSDTEVTYPSISTYPSQILGELYSISLIQTMLSYGLTWGAIALLLYNYSKRIGYWKYLVIISLPIGTFIFGITPILIQLPTTSTYFDPNLMIFRILAISSLLSVGILFGVSFLTAVKALKQYTTSLIVDYLFISAFGISSLFIALAANIAHGAYPPFGIATYGLTSLASYFFMLGIYSSAIYVSADAELRRTIRKVIEEQSKFLDSIGSAQIEREIEKNVSKLTKEYSEQLKANSGIESDLPDDLAKEYLNEVLQEIKREKK
jgi:hypothetical protein